MASSSLRSVNPNAEIMGKQAALFMNINAAKGLQDVMKSNLGPKGTIKMLVGGRWRHALFVRSHSRQSTRRERAPPLAIVPRSDLDACQLSNPARTPRSDAPAPPPADALTVPSPRPRASRPRFSADLKLTKVSAEISPGHDERIAPEPRSRAERTPTPRHFLL